jgi:hypothetical protein
MVLHHLIRKYQTNLHHLINLPLMDLPHLICKYQISLHRLVNLHLDKYQINLHPMNLLHLGKHQINLHLRLNQINLHLVMNHLLNLHLINPLLHLHLLQDRHQINLHLVMNHLLHLLNLHLINPLRIINLHLNLHLINPHRHQDQHPINLHLQLSLVQDQDPHLALNLMIGVITLTGLTGPCALNLVARVLRVILVLFSARPTEITRSVPKQKKVSHATPRHANGQQATPTTDLFIDLFIFIVES